MRIKSINHFIRKTFGVFFGDFEGLTLCPFGIYIEKESIEDDVSDSILYLVFTGNVD
jgi:hypothetical protein